MLILFSNSQVEANLLLKLIFLHGFSVSIHLVLFLILLISWFFKKFRNNKQNVGQKQIEKKIRPFYFKKTLLCCLGMSIFNLVLCLWEIFYWYSNSWSDEKIVYFFDLLLRTLTWLAIYVYLNALFCNSSETKYPLVLRIWWGVFFSISCYSLVLENLYYENHNILHIPLLVSKVISTLLGLFLCNVGISGKNEAEDSRFGEPLLTGKELNKSNGGERVTPYSNASLFSILTFSWMSPLISLGYTKRLDLEDVPQLASVDSVKEAFEVLKSKLECDGGGRKVTTSMLVKALILTTWKEIMLTAFLALIYSFVSFVGPYLIDSFVQYLNGHRESRNEGYLLVFAFFFAKLVECLTQRHWFFKLKQVGIRTKAVLIAMIYNKSLTLSSQSKHVYTSGQIINLMTIDTERIGLFSWYMHDPWLVLVQVALALLIIYKNLGLSCVAAFLAIVIVMLANIPLWTLQEKYHGKLMESKDRRMKAMSEIMRNMKILKLQGWEMKFLSKIFHLRNIETRWLRRNVYTSAISTFFFWGSPTFLSVVTFGACMLMGIPFESGNIFSVLATFRILQEPIRNLPETISMIAQSKVSLDRISSFLCLDDLQSNVIEKIPRGICDTAIEIVNGNFTLDVSSANPIVKDINLRVMPGMRVAVCGTVGSGKSSLVSCILGELPKMSGTIKLSGTKAYVAQSPWIQSGKIEENILFGKEMERERYVKVLDACSLNKDLEILPSGDQTIIGERGINLSGGQKQRIQIARAIYQDADIYIFDDPFSAVDAHTGTHLFKESLLGLLNSKTVLYITHQVEFLPAADLILVMKDGKIAQAGKYLDILTSGTNFMELVDAHKKALSTLDSIEAGSVSDNLNISKNNEVASVKKLVEKQNTKGDQIGKMDNVNEKIGQLVQEEKRGSGRVGFSVYWKYITTAYGGALVPFILFAQVLFQLLQFGSNYWMAWTSPLGKSVALPVTGSTLISVFVALAIGSSFCILARALLLVTAGYKTATLLFNEMHLRIFRAPMSFFDATPSGRILNRASTDQSAVDSNIPHQLGVFAFSIMQLLGVIAVMSQVAWQVFFIFIPVTAIGIWLQQYYIRSAQELARLIGVCKAPVIQHFSETISGSTTIRSFNQESNFRDKIIKLIEGYSRPSFYNAGAMGWLCFRLDILSSILFLFSLLLMISAPEKTIDPSIAGLAITYGLNLNVVQFRIIWNLCNLENKIISLERILQYNCIPDEGPLVIESNKPACLWPPQGEVDIRNLQVRYAPDTPIVLQGITCTFKGGTKIAIVGRTGSGKSTLIQALFRIVEPTAGQIIIDGINISSIGLHDLRSRLSIIPQDPTMFEGTVRSNLDPLEEYTDDEIWEALDKCQLGEDVRKKEGELESTVLENGENWSMGQRQLVCLGRVLLKKSKILVLDEATASVDTTTDTLIQRTLRKHFSGSTVITIAHRITSVLDSDMVLLLNRGLIKEYDSPETLLKNKSSAFAKLVEEYKCEIKL